MHGGVCAMKGLREAILGKSPSETLDMVRRNKDNLKGTGSRNSKRKRSYVMHVSADDVRRNRVRMFLLCMIVCDCTACSL